LSAYAAAPYGFGMSMSMGMGQDLSNMMRNNMLPFTQQPVFTITSIPMITLQIPPDYVKDATPLDIRRALTQVIWISENKTMVPKEQFIHYSKEVLIFYVNRRIQRIQIRTFTNPLAFSQLPMTMSNFERLNNYPVDTPERITLGSGSKTDEIYYLRSVVAVTETNIKQGDKSTNIITGSTGLIMTHRDFAKNIYDQKYYLYDPFGASLPVQLPDGSGYSTNKPISYIEGIFTPQYDETGEIVSSSRSFFDRATHNGTIYIYAKPHGYAGLQEYLNA
jgi:hypothetical protein